VSLQSKQDDKSVKKHKFSLFTEFSITHSTRYYNTKAGKFSLLYLQIVVSKLENIAVKQ